MLPRWSVPPPPGTRGVSICVPFPSLLLHFWIRAAGILGRTHHLLHFGLVLVQRKFVRHSRFRVIEPQRHFVQFEPSVGRVLPDSVPHLLHLRRGHRLKVL